MKKFEPKKTNEMSSATLFEQKEESFDGSTGEVSRGVKRSMKHSHIDVTDQYVKVSKYLHVIYAYHGIPLSLVGISLVFAQRMTWKTNTIYLLKRDKEQIAEMLGCSYERVRSLISDCKKYDIIRPVDDCRGMYEVNAFLFSTGSTVDTRDLQAHFDFDADRTWVQVEQRHLITGESVRKSVTDAQKMLKDDMPGQMTLEDLQEGQQNE